VVAQHVERARLVDRVALHEDALRSLDQGAPSERALQGVEFREALQHDVDRALPLAGVGVADVGEHAAAGGLLDEVRVAGMEQDDHWAGRFADDPVDQVESVRRAVAESDERHVRSFPRGDGTDVFDLDLACDDLVPESHDHRRDEREAVFALVRDQDAKVFGLTAHGRRLP
jgi:hypothetical protein